MALVGITSPLSGLSLARPRWGFSPLPPLLRHSVFNSPFILVQLNLANIIAAYPTVTKGKRSLAGDVASELKNAYKRGILCLMGCPKE